MTLEHSRNKDWKMKSRLRCIAAKEEARVRCTLTVHLVVSVLQVLEICVFHVLQQVIKEKK